MKVHAPRLRARAGRARAEPEEPASRRAPAAAAGAAWASPRASCGSSASAPSKRDPRERVRDYRQYFSLPDEATLREQGGRCMDCGIPFCHEGCPLGNLIPDWNDLVHRGRWQRGAQPAPRHQQLPRVHRPDLPGAVRVGLRARHQRRPGHDRADRAGDRRARLRRGLDRARAARTRTGQDGRRRGLGPGRAGRGGRAQQARPQGHRLRARRGAGRAAALRRARRQAREVDHRPPRRAARGRRASSSCAAWTWAATWTPSSCARRHDAVVVAIGSRVHRDLEAPGRELRRRALRDGLPLPAQPLRGARARAARARETPPERIISAEGRRVLVVGGGDTGMDCISNALREGAERRAACSTSTRRSRPRGGTASTPWPLPPKRTLTTYALEEGGERELRLRGHRDRG